MLFGPLQQGIEDGRAGCVGGVNDASVAVAAFTREVKVVGLAAVFASLAGKGHALLHQPADGIPAVSDNLTYRIFVAQTAAGDQGVLDMGIYGVQTTIPYYRQILEHPDFQAANFNTGFVERNPQLLEYSTKTRPESIATAIAAAIAAQAGL